MKKLSIIALLILASLTSFAQDYFTGLIGYSYLTITENGNQKKVNKPLIIIYNKTYCKLSVGGIVTTFKVDSYSKELVKGDIQESFLNEENNAEPRGWYSISILHNKAGKSQITINMPLMPKGAAYFVIDAQVYSENGRVSGNAHVNNWKELEIQSKRDDSTLTTKKLIYKQDAFVKHINDSLSQVKALEQRLEQEDAILNEGNNYNNTSLAKIIQIIDSTINMKITDKYIYGNIKVFIDKDGNITSCTNFKNDVIIDPIIPQINKLIGELKFRVEPFNKNGKNYPSYCETYVDISPQFYNSHKNNKVKKSKSFNFNIFN